MENEKLALSQEWDKTFSLMIIPGAVHTDLYDNMDVIPFDKITEFFNEYLK